MGTTLPWLVYVARNRIDADRVEAELAEIVRTSCHRNAARGITGALIACETYLAQYIEGPDAVAADLLERIRHDPRQADLRVVERGERADRRFPDWSMAYSGPSVFVRRILADVFDNSDRHRHASAERLLSLMREFTSPPK